MENIITFPGLSPKRGKIADAPQEGVRRLKRYTGERAIWFARISNYTWRHSKPSERRWLGR
jgi:hypothetical protein